MDLIFEATNGATSNNGYSQGGTAGQKLMDVVTKLEIIANGSKTILSVTNVEDLIAEAIRITGKIPARTIREKLSVVQKLHIPIYTGRFIDDKLVVIPNGAYKNGNFFDTLQMKITYNLTVAATAFVTGTFKVSLGVKKLVDGSAPESKLIKTFQHKEDYTTVGGTTKGINLTYGPALYMRSVQVMTYEHTIAEGTDISKLLMEYNSIGGGKVTPFEMPWKMLQKHNAAVYGLPPLTFVMENFFEDTDNIYTMIPDIKTTAFKGDFVLTKTLLIDATPETIIGDDLEMGLWVSGDAAATSLASDTDIYTSITTDVIPKYAYIDFDESKTMNDLLDTGGMTALVLKMTDGAAGGSVRVNEEFIMRATDFRSS